MDNMLQAALWYQKNGFSVFPIEAKDKPLIKWKQFQKRVASKEEVTEWFRDKWPYASIGLVTGKISNLTVVDADSQEGKEAVENYLSDDFETPISKTPRGWHYYFRYTDGLRNSTSKQKPLLTDCDIRSEGGYVVAPPTVFNNNGSIKSYTWLERLKIGKTPIQSLPSSLVEILLLDNPNECSNTSIKKDLHPLYREKIISSDLYRGETYSEAKKRPQLTTTGYNWPQILSDRFPQGARDEALFHIAHHLYHGSMPEQEIEQLLQLINAYCCDPPDEKNKAHQKIKSVLDRAKYRGQNIAEMVREWVLTTSGHFLTTEIHSELQLTTKEGKKAATSELLRLKEDNKIERYGDKRGSYRRIEKYTDVDWGKASMASVDVWLPFDLSDIVSLTPGNMVLFEGAMNAGKSAILMNTAKENRTKFKVYYISSELGPGMFKRRMNKFNDVGLDELQRTIHFRECGKDWHDAIEPGENSLNIIDYLEVHKDFWDIGGILNRIYMKQKGSIVVAAIQKAPGAEFGRGGSFLREKPALNVSLDSGVAKIVKCKEWKHDIDPPTGKQRFFRIVDGCKLLDAKNPPRNWHTPFQETK